MNAPRAETAEPASPPFAWSWLTRLSGWAFGQLILIAARVITGVRPLWHRPVPVAARPPRVYFANHGSHGDFVLVWTTLGPGLRRQTRAVSGRDYWLASALRRFIACHVFNVLLIDRAPPTGVPSPVDRMAAALAAGESLIFFPEGTRNTSEATLLPFKSGIYHLACACPQAEFVPVWIDNIRRVIPKGQWLPVPMVCTVSYGEALSVQPGETKDAFISRAMAAVLAQRPKESQQ